MKKIIALLSFALLSGCASNPEMAALAASTLALPDNPNTAQLDVAGLASVAENQAVQGLSLGLQGSNKRYQCQDLTFEEAQELLQTGHSYLDPESDGVACMALNNTVSTEPATEPAPVIVAAPIPDVDIPHITKHVARQTTKTARSASSGSNCTWVDGYTRKNGTHVRGHQRCR
ncbi:MAG: hypothetical protein BWK73_04830 [Thiothrix lacustris]|uniref:Excalibur calcium-binding domain-containing protein n=1 Tax=Thiothrix lacustris TaxID=525917 RepID=A0A1Y1QYH5_9GAMM|nr:MAG: hypothetical protein BWK73_04830 [Thiothrix lacustris]